MSSKELTGSIVIRHTFDIPEKFLPEKSFDLRNILAKLISDNGARYDITLSTTRVELRLEEVKSWEYQHDALLIEVEVDGYDGMQNDGHIARALLVLWKDLFPKNESLGIRMKYRDATYVSRERRW